VGEAARAVLNPVAGKPDPFVRLRKRLLPASAGLLVEGLKGHPDLCDALELLEPHSEPVAIGVVLAPPWQPHRRACNRLEALLKQRTVMQHQRPLGDVDTTIGVDPDQRHL